jgi:hypothetical protein
MPHPIGWSWDDRPDPQRLFDVAVVMPTVVRPSILRALDSIFAQDFPGQIQVLIGVDRAQGDMGLIDEAMRGRPPNVSGYVLALPYSTSLRNGGVHSAFDGGSLRAMLTLAAHARYVSYLDDDNAWLPHHLRLLRTAIGSGAYAFSKRVLVRDSDFAPIVEDRWDSLGPRQGRFAASGGLVDPSCLMIDKVLLTNELARWADAGPGGPGVTADRNFFAGIHDRPHGSTGEATVLYAVRPTNVMLQFARAEALKASAQAGTGPPGPAEVAR